jgi:hypothetical protein
MTLQGRRRRGVKRKAIRERVWILDSALFTMTDRWVGLIAARPRAAERSPRCSMHEAAEQ